jgi:hypothetical protein
MAVEATVATSCFIRDECLVVIKLLGSAVVYRYFKTRIYFLNVELRSN